MSPATPLEGRGGWATLGEGEAFCDSVASTSNRVDVMNYGVSIGGLPLKAYRVGNPGSPGGGAPLLVIGSQHGDEPSGREAAFRILRDLAYDEDPETLRRLAAHPVIVIPTPNPDGIESGRRENGAGADINRCHINLSAPESKALATLLRVLDPILMVDAHEKWDPATTVDFKAHEPAACPPLRDLGAATVNELIALYPAAGVHPANNHEGTLVNATNGRGIPSMLIEVLTTLPPEDATAHQLKAIRHLIAREPEAYVSAQNAAREWHRLDGLFADMQIFGYESGWLNPPLGYTVDTALTATFDAFAIRAWLTSAGSTRVYVPMDQPMAPIIPLLLDPRMPRPVKVATPVYAGDDAAVDFLSQPDALHFSTGVRLASGRPRRLVTRDGIIWGS